MAKVKPAGVINVGFESDMKAVFTPPISVVLPANPFISTVKTNAIIFAHLSRAELFVAILPLSTFNVVLKYKMLIAKSKSVCTSTMPRRSSKKLRKQNRLKAILEKKGYAGELSVKGQTDQDYTTGAPQHGSLLKRIIFSYAQA